MATPFLLKMLIGKIIRAIDESPYIFFLLLNNKMLYHARGDTYDFGV